MGLLSLSHSKKSKASRVETKSISILDDSDSGRSSPPSSSPASSPSSISTCPSVVSAADDASVEKAGPPSLLSGVDTAMGGASTSVGVKIGAGDCLVSGHVAALGDTPPSVGAATEDEAGKWRKKRVALFVDSESPEEKRKKRLSNQA